MVAHFIFGGVFIFPLVLLFHISNMMSAQEQLQLTEEAVMIGSLSGIHSKVALLLWVNSNGHLLHPLVETRLNEIGSSQMTQVDNFIKYHVQSFTKEPETVASNFSNADEDKQNKKYVVFDYSSL